MGFILGGAYILVSSFLTFENRKARFLKKNEKPFAFIVYSYRDCAIIVKKVPLGLERHSPAFCAVFKFLKAVDERKKEAEDENDCRAGQSRP